MSSTKKSLYRFIFFYTTSTMAILVAFSILFFTYQKKIFIDTQRQTLKSEADNIVLLVKSGNLDKIRTIKNIQYALYNGRKEFIDGNYKPNVTKWQLDIKHQSNALEMVYLLPPPHPYHIAYLVIKKDINTQSLKELVFNIILALIVLFIVLIIVGYFLGKLFVKPMQDTIRQLNEFTQDATHELNTPITVILNNIEMMQILNKCQDVKELNRVKVASKTLSKIYEDLSYMNLNSNIHRDINLVNLSKLTSERLDYFNLLIESKNIHIKKSIEPDITIKGDKKDFIRVLDNLVSNAIKYNKNNGSMYIELSKNRFIISDSGIGIKKESLKDIFNRFQRANKSEGGFGLGLSIVKEVCNIYGFNIKIESEENIGTKVIIDF